MKSNLWRLLLLCFVVYLIVFLVSLVCLDPLDQKLYFYSIQNLDYYVWLLDQFEYPLYYIVLFVGFLFLFPIFACIFPSWDLLLNMQGSFHPIPLLLTRDKPLAKKMQSKLFWYECFRENGIATPPIAIHLVGNKKREISAIDPTKKYIIKPTYGTCGKDIYMITREDIDERIEDFMYYYHDAIIQEYIPDCYSATARNVRLYTLVKNRDHVSSSSEVVLFTSYLFSRKNATGEKIASNVGDVDIELCKENICDFLSQEEQRQIKQITDSLITLHTARFEMVPCIGWDVGFSCEGHPFVFEGNLGAEIMNHGHDEYIEWMRRAYLTPVNKNRM